MYFKDTVSAMLERPRLRLRFRVARCLNHFSGQYDPGDEQHFISFLFCSGKDVDTFLGACKDHWQALQVV